MSHAWSTAALGPFAELGELRSRFDRMFDEFADGRERAWTPAVDVVRNNGNLALRVDIPGIKPEEVKIEVEDDILTVSTEHEESKEEKDKNYVRRERRYRSFSRSMALPPDVEAKSIKDPGARRRRRRDDPAPQGGEGDGHGHGHTDRRLTPKMAQLESCISVSPMLPRSMRAVAPPERPRHAPRPCIGCPNDDGEPRSTPSVVPCSLTTPCRSHQPRPIVRLATARVFKRPARGRLGGDPCFAAPMIAALPGSHR